MGAARPCVSSPAGHRPPLHVTVDSLQRILFQPFLFRPDLGCGIHLTGGALGVRPPLRGDRETGSHSPGFWVMFPSLEQFPQRTLFVFIDG